MALRKTLILRSPPTSVGGRLEGRTAALQQDGGALTLRERAVANLGLAIMILVWGAFFPLLERLLELWDFYSVTLARQILGGLVLLLGVILERRRAPLPRRIPYGGILVLGGVGIAISSLLTSLGVLYSSGLSSAIISTTNPVTSALTAAAVSGERLLPGTVFGTVLSAAGGIVSVLGEGRLDGAHFHGGEILIVIANVTWTWMSMAAQRWLMGCSQLQITAFTVLAGAFWLLLFLPVVPALGLVALRVDFGFESLWMLGFAAVLPIALGNFLWHFGVSRLGVVVASMYNNLVPAAALGVTVLLGGSFALLQLLGAAIILTGVFGAQLLALRSGERSGTR